MVWGGDGGWVGVLLGLSITPGWERVPEGMEFGGCLTRLVNTTQGGDL